MPFFQFASEKLQPITLLDSELALKFQLKAALFALKDLFGLGLLPFDVLNLDFSNPLFVAYDTR